MKDITSRENVTFRDLEHIDRESEYVENITLRDLVYVDGDEFRISAPMCHNCYFSMYESCNGVVKGLCQQHELYYDPNQAYAEYLTREKLNENTYLFARVFDIDIEDHLKDLKETLITISEKKEKGKLEYYNEIISEIEEVLNIPDSEIERLKIECNASITGKELSEIISDFSKENLDDYYSVYKMVNKIDKDMHRMCEERISFISLIDEDISGLEIPKSFKLKGIKPCYYDEVFNMIVTGIRETEIYGKERTTGKFGLDTIKDKAYMIYPNIELKKEIYKWAKKNNLKVTTDYEEYGLNEIPF